MRLARGRRFGQGPLRREKATVKEQRLSLQRAGGARGNVGAWTLMGVAPACVLWRKPLLFMPALGEAADQPPRLAVDVVLKVGQ